MEPFLLLEISVLEFQNILDLGIKYVLILEFMEWISSLFYLEEEKEFVIENIKKVESEISKKFLDMMLKSGL